MKINKFKEFIKESSEDENKLKIPEEEVEDQFLRLKEIYGYEYSMPKKISMINGDRLGFCEIKLEKMCKKISGKSIHELQSEIEAELDTIIRRIESKYNATCKYSFYNREHSKIGTFFQSYMNSIFLNGKRIEIEENEYYQKIIFTIDQKL